METEDRTSEATGGSWSRNVGLPEGLVTVREYAKALGEDYQVFRHAMVIRTAAEEGRDEVPNVERGRSKKLAEILVPPAGMVATMRVWYKKDLEDAGVVFDD